MHTIRDHDLTGGAGHLARASAACVLGLLLCACGGSPDLVRTTETIASWTATVRLARAEHRAHAVGDAYARQLLDRAREARKEARRSLGAATTSTAQRDRADSALAALDGEARQLAAELARR